MQSKVGTNCDILVNRSDEAVFSLSLFGVVLG